MGLHSADYPSRYLFNKNQGIDGSGRIDPISCPQDGRTLHSTQGVVLINSRQKALLCRKIAEDRKGIHPLILDLRSYGTITDFFVIVSGTSDRQVSSLAEEMQKVLSKKDLHPLGIEGLQASRWILLDYEDVVIHLFQEADRTFYDLEGLWSDAPRL